MKDHTLPFHDGDIVRPKQVPVRTRVGPSNAITEMRDFQVKGDPWPSTMCDGLVVNLEEVEGAFSAHDFYFVATAPRKKS